MALPENTTVTLRIWGDDLVPDEVSELLGQHPTNSERKGVQLGKHKRVAKTGGWRLSAPNRQDGNLNAQILELFDMVTDDFVIWDELKLKFELDLFCGVFMSSSNNGINLTASTLELLGQRGIKIGFDIYDFLAD